MKILKLLNRKYLSIIFIIFLIGFNTHAEDKPIDIWNIDEKKIEENATKNTSIIEGNIIKQSEQSSIYEMQSQKKIDNIRVDSSVNSKEQKIIGLYDPEDYDLKIDMWSNSNGDQLKNISSKKN